MRVLIASGFRAGRSTEGEPLADHLGRLVRARGHSVEFLRLPVRGGEDTLSAMLVAQTLEVTNTDHVIATGFPAQLLRHPSKSVWLLDAVDSPVPAQLQAAVASATEQSATEANSAFAASWQDAARFQLPALIVGRTALAPRAYPTRDLLASADDELELIFMGLSRAPAQIRLVITGAVSDDHRELAVTMGLAPRVEFLSSDPASALVGVSAFVTISGESALVAEAARRGIPTVSATGVGLAGILVDSETGWLVEAFPDELADAFSSIAFRPGLARSRGHAAKAREAAAHVSWSVALDRVLP